MHMQNSASPLYCRIYALVSRIPAGRVTTYGRIARLADCTARTVGFAMAALPTVHDLPWRRCRPSTISHGNE